VGADISTLNIVVIFLLSIAFYSKNLSIEEFSNKNSFFNVFLFGSFFGKKFDCKKVPFFKFMLLKNYLAQKAENFVNLSRTHAGKNKIPFVKMLIVS
jgi:hypothetical protein